MSALEILIHLIKRFEGCRLKAYQDIVGVWTIGYGETLGVKEGDVWTQEQSDKRLESRAMQFLLATLKRCPQLNLEHPSRQAACACLAYNIGVGAFGSSSVCKRTKEKNYIAAADAFLLWNKAGGKAVRGLTLRRETERAYYLQSK